MAVLLGVFSGYQVYTDSERSECQTKFNVAFSEQARIRSVIAAQADRAQSDLLLGVSKLISTTPSDDPKVRAQRTREFLTLFRTFETEVDQVEEARKANPLPPLPDCAKF